MLPVNWAKLTTEVRNRVRSRRALEKAGLAFVDMVWPHPSKRLLGSTLYCAPLLTVKYFLRGARRYIVFLKSRIRARERVEWMNERLYLFFQPLLATGPLPSRNV